MTRFHQNVWRKNTPKTWQVHNYAGLFTKNKSPTGMTLMMIMFVGVESDLGSSLQIPKLTNTSFRIQNSDGLDSCKNGSHVNMEFHVWKNESSP